MVIVAEMVSDSDDASTRGGSSARVLRLSRMWCGLHVDSVSDSQTSPFGTTCRQLLPYTLQ